MKINVRVVILYIILILADNTFWLVNSSLARRGQDLAALLIVILCFLSMLNRERKITLGKQNEMHYLMIFPLFMALYSSVLGNFNFGQSIGRDILAQRYMYTGFLIYFPVAQAINRNKNYLEKLIHVIIVLGVIEVAVYLPQFFLADKFIYLSCNITQRFGTIRLYTSSCAMPILIFYCINAIMIKKRKTLKYWIGALSGLYYTIIVSKTRLAMVAYVVALIVGYLLWKRGGIRKILMAIPMGIGAIYLYNTELFQYLIGGINAQDSSAQIRIVGRQHYISKLLSNVRTFLFGNGYINSTVAERYAGVDKGIYVVDLGIYGIAFFFGIIGVLWLVFLFAKMYKKAWKLTKCRNYFCLMYLVYLTILLPNGTAFIWQIQASAILAMIACYMEKCVGLEMNCSKVEY